MTANEIFAGVASLGTLIAGVATAVGLWNRRAVVEARDAARHASSQLSPSPPFHADSLKAGEDGAPTIADAISDLAVFARAFLDHARDGHGADHDQWAR